MHTPTGVPSNNIIALTNNSICQLECPSITNNLDTSQPGVYTSIKTLTLILMGEEKYLHPDLSVSDLTK